MPLYSLRFEKSGEITSKFSFTSTAQSCLMTGKLSVIVIPVTRSKHRETLATFMQLCVINMNQRFTIVRVNNKEASRTRKRTERGTATAKKCLGGEKRFECVCIEKVPDASSTNEREKSNAKFTVTPKESWSDNA